MPDSVAISAQADSAVEELEVIAPKLMESGAASGAWFTASMDAGPSEGHLPPAQRSTAFVMPGFGIGGKRNADTQSAEEVASELEAAEAPTGEDAATRASAPKRMRLAETIAEWGHLSAEEAQLPVKPFEANGHHLHTAGPTIFCAICGAYGKGAFKKLHAPCTGPPARKERLNRLAQGKDPNSNAVLGTVRRTVRGDVAATQ